MSVNFRGSTGSGSEFRNKGRREWGRRMQRDLDDAVDWAIARGIADEKRIAIMGMSYGGYATLAGLSFTPLRYKCGVAFAAPTNLVGLVLQPTKPQRRAERFWVGDAYTAEGRKDLLDRSPTQWLENIKHFGQFEIFLAAARKPAPLLPGRICLEWQTDTIRMVDADKTFRCIV